MTSRAKRFLTVGALLAVVAALIGGATWRRIAIAAAPEKRQATSRSPAAVAADSLFWRTFHGGRYDQIQPAIEVLTQAYLQTPNDAVTAGHLGWLHIWRIAEGARLDSAPASITEDMVLARRFLGEAVRLDESDPRTLGFLAAATMAEGDIHRDERLVRRGYFMMKDAIDAWPAFNLFTAGFVVSRQPRESKRFRDGLEMQWRLLDVCAGERFDRTRPDFARYITRATDRRACLNTWITPHNFEGFFLNMGDMLVKAGDWQTAQQIYANARLVPEFATWKFASVLEDRIRNAQANVTRFNDRDADPKTGIMFRSPFTCMACHQQ